MARRKSKSKSSPGTAQEQAPAQITSSAPLPGTRPAPQAAPTAHVPQEQQDAAPAGMVRKGTFIMGVALALVLGLYVGSLIPSMLHGSAQQPMPPQQAAAPGAQVPAQAPEGSRPAPQASMPQVTPELSARIGELEKSLLDNPRDASRWASLGNLYFDTAQAQKAVSAYERSLSIAPDNALVLTDLGIMQRELGQFDKAVASFRKASSLQPDLENAMFNEGVVLYYDLKRKDEAEIAWKRLLKVNPGARAPDGKPVSELIQHLH
ncbi:tetratricopeptide repeat protein [Desulfovibrio sp. 86]|uniref:Tetratricopeptide TPR_2 repeat protein n=1 Tax=uncultured Desulfovibrio sp. TaxID=167968 RepID=A0A212L5L2_9BACT|nr:tetratricopeptide repeat protein [Desulfovibrio sp. 86]SCM72841.1 Tetratricopeptide TPR_2 repeat protein [uncultured Desulfovibrio sp.]VZH33776.1 Tetratricopeptide TPR_2 repeat protein [Desulfovibrio sp. 86]